MSNSQAAGSSNGSSNNAADPNAKSSSWYEKRSRSSKLGSIADVVEFGEGDEEKKLLKELIKRKHKYVTTFDYGSYYTDEWLEFSAQMKTLKKSIIDGFKGNQNNSFRGPR